MVLHMVYFGVGMITGAFIFLFAASLIIEHKSRGN